MRVYDKKQELNSFLKDEKSKNKSIGFVPTMGALHKGHLALVREAKENNDLVVVSIFVNPTQFDKKEDLDNYPVTLDNDKELLTSVDCDVVFIPSVLEIYGKKTQSTHFDFDGLEHEMEGKFREGHFDGVGTIVKELFEIVVPDNAYFGQKDFQQLQIIKKMVQKHNLPVTIIGCNIFREDDGLAMSSRNTRLTKEQRAESSFIYKTLKEVYKKFNKENIDAIELWVTKEFHKNEILELEYFTIAEEETLKPAKHKNSSKKYRAFIAVFAGKIRLIDNISLSN